MAEKKKDGSGTENRIPVSAAEVGQEPAGSGAPTTAPTTAPRADLSKLFSNAAFGKSAGAESPDAKVVYSSDPTAREAANRKEPTKSSETVPSKISPVLRIEKGGRGGKTVTVVDQLPRNDDYLAALTTRLKKLCGSGGTHRIGPDGGIVEVQGDHRDRLRKFFEAEGARVRGG